METLKLEVEEMMREDIIAYNVEFVAEKGEQVKMGKIVWWERVYDGERGRGWEREREGEGQMEKYRVKEMERDRGRELWMDM